MNPTDYSFNIRPLPKEDGGGFLVTFPDLPGCISDGETPEEAVRNGLDAAKSWLNTAHEYNDPIPVPGETSSGRFITRLPKSLHARLVSRARQEGVSMNALVTSFLAESLGKQDARLKSHK